MAPYEVWGGLLGCVGSGEVIAEQLNLGYEVFFFILGWVMCVWGRWGVLSLLVLAVEISSLCSCL